MDLSIDLDSSGDFAFFRDRFFFFFFFFWVEIMMGCYS